MQNKFHLIVLYFLICNTLSFAVNPLLENSGIVDIGRKITTTEIEVPKGYIYTNPTTTFSPNITTYNNRLQSELFQCENDFLGTETCPRGVEECSGYEEFIDGYSTKHHIKKTFFKMCILNTVKENDKCYYDANNDGLKDLYYTVIYNSRTVWSQVFLNGSNSKSENGILTMPPYSMLRVKHYSAEACDDDANHVVIKINDISKKDTWCNGSKNTGWIDVYENTTSSNTDISYSYYDAHSGGGWDRSNMYEAIHTLNSTPPLNFTKEVSGDNIYFYKSAQCPANTILQTDGTCLMEYDYYTYHCPADTNYYQYPWQIRDSGEDCGNPTCTNSDIVPTNNCVRSNYSCPNNPNSKCGKSIVEDIDCGDGYVWNDNRCERLESFCGSSTYNASKDICEDITHYTKLCTNAADIYSIELNKCVSNTEICKNGIYSSETKTCVMDFVGSCTTSGYAYDLITQSCIDSNLKICTQDGYIFDSTKSKCIGTMTMCDTGKTYNSTTNKCEDNMCGELNTEDKNNRCETSNQCDGTITSTGKCIPDKIQ